MTSKLRILGIETSCDETAAAVVTRLADGSAITEADVVLSQLDEHSAYGGVVPEIAARAHVDALDTLIEEALTRAGITLAEVDAIAATSGPGLIGGLLVGLMTGKAIARATGKPLYAVNHLEGHALTARLTDGARIVIIGGGFIGLEVAASARQQGCAVTVIEGAPRLLGRAVPERIGAQVLALHRAQDVGHPSAAAISLTVNGQPRQSSDIAKLIWSVSECVAYLSEYEALEPGDIIATGTPVGVGIGFNPPKFLAAGDVVRIEIDGIGVLENPVG